jgi:hypothetical protein
MTPLQLELTKLLGRKELTKGCEIVVHDENFIMYSNDRKAIVQDTMEKWDLFLLYYVWYRANRNSQEKKIPMNGWVHYDDKETMGSIEIIGHPATLSDFHRSMTSVWINWNQNNFFIEIIWEIDSYLKTIVTPTSIPYDSSLWLLEQNEETLKQIIELINSNK